MNWLRKLADGEFDALVLAAAGLARLGRRGEIGGVLAELVPAAGQGALLIEGRPGASMPPYDWAKAKREMEQLAGVEVARRDVISYALYPKVMREYMEHRALHGDTSVLPTPTFFYGLRVGEEAWIDIEPGKTLIIKLLSVGDVEADGARTLTFELNGQPRSRAQ